MENKKTVLFICAQFFGYEVAIKTALLENGLDVDYFDERSANNSLMKAMLRVKKSLVKRTIAKYYESITEKIKNKKYDYFLLVKGEVVPEDFILKFKSLNPNAKLIYYTYDSIRNNPANSTFILNHFDSCYSFDFEDVKLDSRWKLKHLFYTKEFIADFVSDRKYDISFVGTMHSNRFSVMKRLFEKFNNTFVFYYMPAKWFFYLEKLTKKEFKPIKITDVSFDKMSKKQVADVFKASKSVLDVQRFGQTGLTMRTFEVLASGAKLVTSNKHIKDVEFYNSNNIIVINDLNDDQELFEIVGKVKQSTDAVLKTNKDFEKYYINNWITEFFN
ncbi:hypothetical protein HDC90_004756 [Pedobacter sp. AK013]|uniref:glycosyltransferase family protein n=1 Tax=Pedobacter sp. AK013 TaxID=2723071 RepID=UPI0016192760|nr:hypothetical protein [Pedobacter sp. AK013]MBB6240092.1 hypothetical protein [Pedobacter sp. AK013]